MGFGFVDVVEEAAANLHDILVGRVRDVVKSDGTKVWISERLDQLHLGEMVMAMGL